MRVVGGTAGRLLPCKGGLDDLAAGCAPCGGGGGCDSWAPAPAPTQFALKIDRKADVKTVKQEYHTLRQLQEACTQVVRVHDGAKVSGRWLMTMDLLGPNLATLLKSAYCGPLDLSAAKVMPPCTLLTLPLH